MDYCTGCGRQAESGNIFCNGCGTRLSPSVPEAHDSQPRQQQQPGPAAQATRPSAVRADALDFRVPAERPRGAPPRPGTLRRVMAVAVALVVVCCVAVVALIALRSPQAKRNLSSNTAVSSSPERSTAQPSAAGSPAEQVAAQALSQLLAQSTADRTAIVAAFNDVSSCGSDLSGDAQTFQQAASSRENLLSQLNALPEKDALPAQLLQELTGAWQSSSQADQDFASWAMDENSGGCTPDDTSDSSYQAATEPDDQATADKQAFVNLWNPIASKYGLSTYQQGQL